MDPRYSPRTNLKHKKEEIHMKRKLLSVLLVLAMALTLLPTAAFAEDTLTSENLANGGTVSTGTVTIPADQTIELTNPIEVTGGNVTITLNGNLKGPSGKAAILVSGGTVSIEGSGTVTGVGSKGAALRNNGGTVTVKGGTYTTENGNASSYAIWNGDSTKSAESATSDVKMIFPENSTAVVTRSDPYTAICNKYHATMEIAGGKFTSGSNIALKNDYYGSLSISGGTFENTNNANAVVTFWTTTISGGTFKSMVASAMDGGEVGSLTINGGTFEKGLAVGVFSGVDHVAQGKQAAITVQDGAIVQGVIKKADGTDWYADASKDNVKLTIAGGTFSLDEQPEGDWLALPAGKVFKQEDSKWVLGEPEKAALAFTNPEGNTDFFGKTAEAMGTFTVGTPTTNSDTGVTTIKVTGSANYLTGYDGWQVDTEEEGHYLPLHIAATPSSLEKITTYNRTVGAKEGKEIALTDGAEDVAFFLDGKETCAEATETTFKVVASDKAGASEANVYVIDFSGVTLLPKPANENIEIKPGTDPENPSVSAENSSANVKVEVPEAAGGEEGLGKLQIEVKGAAAADVETADSTDATVAAAIKGSDSKAVEVTVKQIKEDGSVETENQFTADEALKDNPITVTISGLDTGATYHVFCVKDDKSVVYYGSKELTDGATSIEFTTLHLCHFAAVKETTELAAALENTPVAPGTGLTGSTPLTPGGVYYEVATAAGTIGDKVTIHGEAGKFYIVQIWNGRNTPAAIFCLSSGSGTEVEFYANSGATINIWQADSASAFDGKVPQGLTKVEPQA